MTETPPAAAAGYAVKPSAAKDSVPERLMPHAVAASTSEYLIASCLSLQLLGASSMATHWLTSG
jgi:hypothetical protein